MQESEQINQSGTSSNPENSIVEISRYVIRVELRRKPMEGGPKGVMVTPGLGTHFITAMDDEGARAAAEEMARSALSVRVYRLVDVPVDL